MRVRSLVLFGAGIMAGLAIARKLREDDPEVLHGPSRGASSADPKVRAVTTQAQRIADRAAVASLDVLRKARGAIRERLTDDDAYDEVTWN